MMRQFTTSATELWERVQERRDAEEKKPDEPAPPEVR